LPAPPEDADEANCHQRLLELLNDDRPTPSQPVEHLEAGEFKRRLETERQAVAAHKAPALPDKTPTEPVDDDSDEQPS
jgi:hypothetical protein